MGDLYVIKIGIVLSSVSNIEYVLNILLIGHNYFFVYNLVWKGNFFVFKSCSVNGVCRKSSFSCRNGFTLTTELCHYSLGEEGAWQIEKMGSLCFLGRGIWPQYIAVLLSPGGLYQSRSSGKGGRVEPRGGGQWAG